MVPVRDPRQQHRVQVAEDGREGLASLGRSFPWRRSVAQSKEYREGQPIKSVDVVLKLAEQGRTWPAVAAWSDTERFANPVLREMGDGQVSVRDGLERIRAEADRLLTAA